MIRQRLHIQSIEQPSEMMSAISETVSSIVVQEIDIAVAYATRKGCELLSERLRSQLSNWRSIKKRWLVSINGRVTEPGALRFLQALPNSEVRVPNVKTLLATGCRGSALFHCKLYFFEAPRVEHIAVFSGSPNMTASGLLTNVEQAHSVVLKPRFTPSEAKLRSSIKAKKSQILSIFSECDVLTSGLLTRYEELPRPKFRPDNSNVFRSLGEGGTEATPATDLTLATAKNLWVEIRTEISNSQVGSTGNQMDGPRGMRVFFNESPAPVEKNHIFGPIRLRLGGETYHGTLKYGDNGMDKLNLPPCYHPGPKTYVDSTVLFTRRRDGSFDMTVGGSVLGRRWKSISANQGTSFRMRSGREWGAFS